LTPELAAKVRASVALLQDDLAIINAHFCASRTVQHRLKEVGTLTRTQASELGLVGMAARSCGIAMDARLAPDALPPYGTLRPEGVVEPSGDCWARGVLRIREMDASLAWVVRALEAQPTWEPVRTTPVPLKENSLAIAVCEGWRGEVVHGVETGPTGALRSYRVQDPSLRNWFGLALAVRNNEISDFPICNKSFDLSYCGNDL